jgi:hypothetical protein
VKHDERHCELCETIQGLCLRLWIAARLRRSQRAPGSEDAAAIASQLRHRVIQANRPNSPARPTAAETSLNGREAAACYRSLMPSGLAAMGQGSGKGSLTCRR